MTKGKTLSYVIGGAVLLFLLGGSRKRTSLPSALRLQGKQRLLLIGDSLSVREASKAHPTIPLENGSPFGHTPGQRLAEHLTDAGATVLVNAIGGRNINGFVKGSTCGRYKTNTVCEPAPGIAQLERLIDEFDPQTLLLMLGTNCVAGIAVQPTEEKQKAEQKHVLSNYRKVVEAVQAKGKRVVGIGPPDFDPSFLYRSKYGKGYLQEANDRFVPALAKIFGPGNFVDSRALTQDLVTPAQGRSTDFIHFGGKASAKWASRLFDVLA